MTVTETASPGADEAFRAAQAAAAGEAVVVEAAAAESAAQETSRLRQLGGRAFDGFVAVADRMTFLVGPRHEGGSDWAHGKPHDVNPYQLVFDSPYFKRYKQPVETAN